jgi:hypothetical protein
MRPIILFFLMALTFAGCKKSNESPSYHSLGVITGDEILFCPASIKCGGLEITIKNDPTKNPPPFYLIYSNLQQLGINPNTTYPINVSLDWTHDTTAADYIIVSKIKVDS